MNGQDQTVNNNESFFEVLMNHIMQGVNIPKVQMERVLGPILGMFIEDVMSSLLGDEVITLSPEFPLRKEGNKQSTNIDWLMYRPVTQELLLVELKTTDSTVLPTQGLLYKKLGVKIAENSASFLIEDLKVIAAASSESGKYRNVIKALDARALDFSRIRSSRIVYILPELSKARVEKFGIKDVFSFADLFIEPGRNIAFKKEWKIFKSHLKKLDRVTKASPNEIPSRRLDFNEAIELCRKKIAASKPIFIGFVGGSKKLSASALEILESRMYKWSGNREGNKQIDNWISGSDFLTAVENKIEKMQDVNPMIFQKSEVPTS